PFPLYYIPFVGVATAKYYELLRVLVTWVARHVFQVDVTLLANGSGDSTFNYVQLFCFLVLAATATLVWSLLDRKRRNYARLHEWLRVLVRLSLATAMVTYGGIKLIPTQFPAPPLDRLLQPFGDASPMGLLWTFIGASKAYQSFSGAAEMLGGLLLIGRRTTLLGALVSIGVVGNVVMLNFSYDVPVKLYSAHLFLMAVFLVAPDLRRLADFFLFNRTPAPAETRPLFRRVWLNRVVMACCAALVLYTAGEALYYSYQSLIAPKSPLYGIWNVEEVVIDGQAQRAPALDESRWRRVVFDSPSRLAIQLANQHRIRYNLNLNPQKRLLELTKREDPKWKSTLSYERLGADRLVLAGKLDGRQVRVSLRLDAQPDFLLVNRGFHWINEYPFNR
ncbi:MAG TPA: hypothetical protein VIC28_17265, partial [Thermoanaerobaculia bacterium]